MRIELDSLAGSKGAFAYTYAPGELDFKDGRVRLNGSPRVSGSLVFKGKRLHVQGHLLAETEVDCDRCLNPVVVPVDASFNLHYLTREDYESSEAVELEDQDMIVSVFDGQAFDVDELVSEQLLLAVPDYKLCREDCRGLCPVCGGDLNTKQCGHEEAEIDPRWAGLKNLKS